MPADVKEVYLAAAALAPADRPGYLHQACGGDAELRRRVETLLRAHDDADDMLLPDGTTAYQSRAAGFIPAEAVGKLIAGRYTLVEPIGEGGMGEVWVAKQSEPVKRKVALKLIKAGMDTKAVLQRFDAERQALAMMDHPNIAKVLDGGMTAERRPFFVMELVNGLPLTKFCDEAKLGIRDRLELFVSICRAVQHAHQKGIIHRDLKPSNILVTVLDGKPVTKIIDFGVAKAVGGRLTDESLSTQFGAVVGTLEYMSPEQAGFSAADVDTRADIYSLGVILYELLTGLRPIDSNRLRQAVVTEMIRIIREEEPSKPSTRLSTDASAPSLAALRHMEPKKLEALLRGELDWVVMKCLEKDRDRRYETANGLARDIQRYLADEPVEAHPPNAGYRMKKFLRKHKGPAIAASLVGLALVAGIVGTTWGLLRAERERMAAEAARKAEAEQRQQAEQANLSAMQALRSFTDDLMEKQIASKTELSKNETSMLRNALKQWDVFAQSKGESAAARAIRAEGANRVAGLQKKLGLNAEAEANYRTAVTILDQLATEFPAKPEYRSELAQTETYLGGTLMDANRLSESEEHLRRALTIQEKLVAEFAVTPEYAVDLAKTWVNLGILMTKLGKHVEAEVHFRQALKIQDKLAVDTPDERNLANLSQSLNNMGRLLSELGKMPEAEDQYRKGVAIRTKLVADFPDAPQHRYDLAFIHCNLGNLRLDVGAPADAEGQYRAALVILEKLIADFPAMPQYRFELGRTHGLLADLFNGLEKPEQAEEQYRKSLVHREKLTVDFPLVPQYRSSLSTGRNNLASLLNKMGRREEAEDQFRQAIAIQEELAADYPNIPHYKIVLGTCLYNFGNLHVNNGKLNEGFELFERAIRILTPVYEQDRRLATAKRFLKYCYWGRADVYDRLERYAEAATDWNTALELSGPAEQPPLRFSRANSRMRAGQEVAASMLEIGELAKLDTWDQQQWYVFACTYVVASAKDESKKDEYTARAIELLQKAVKAGFKDRDQIANNKDLDPLREREDFKKVIAGLEAKAAQNKKPPQEKKP